MTFLASPESAEIWIRHGGFIRPNSAVDDRAYPDPHLEKIAALLAGTPTLAYDASDQMPPAVGSETLWPSITSWTSGAID